MKPIALLFIPIFCLLVTSCATLRYTSFAPFDARLEPIPGGGAQYLVLLNTGDVDIHNYSGSVYIWFGKDPNVTRRDTRAGTISGHTLKVGSSIRFHYSTLAGESPILATVSKVELVGHCDEGDFREAWVITESGQLRNIIAKPETRNE